MQPDVLPAPCTMEASAWGTEQIISFHLILRQLVCLFEFLYGSWKCRKPLSNNTCQTSSWQTNNFEDVLLSFVLPRANISFTAPSKQQDDKQSWTRLHFLVAKCQLKHTTVCLHGNKRLRDLTWIFPRSMFSDSDTQLLNAAKNQDETNHALNTWTFVLVVKICTTAYSMSIHQTVHTVHIQTVPQTKHIYSSKPSFVCLSCLLEINFYWWAE